MRRSDSTAAAGLGLVTGRSRRYLRTAGIMLTVVVAASASVMLYMEHGYLQQKHDFENNTNLRVVSVTHREVTGADWVPLDTGDQAKIRAAVAGATTGESPAIVSDRLEFGVGISTPDDRTFMVYGVDPGLAPVLGLASMRDGVAYSTQEAPGPLTLRVPVVTETGGGAQSSATDDYRVVVADGLDAGKVDYLLEGNSNGSLFVTADTFHAIAERMFRSSWSDVLRRSAAGELNMIPLVAGVFVYVDDIYRVEAVAQAVQQAGYGSTYGLQAFDDLESSLRTSTVLGVGVTAVLMLAAGLYLTTSWRTYLTLSRRDIGILKHWGVPEPLIRATYARRLSVTCWVALLCGLAVSVAAGPALLGVRSGLLAAALNGTGLAALLLVLRFAAARAVIAPQLSLDVLTLLKREREFQ